jgi:hypothetical protein
LHEKNYFCIDAIAGKINQNIRYPDFFMNLPALNLTPFDPLLRQNRNANEIFDSIRKKWVRLTNEEWVRQSFLNHLIVSLGYPSGRIGVEFSVKYHQLKRRTDAVVFDEFANPLVIIECKATTVQITEDVFFQACMYNRSLKAKWLFLTNGLRHVAADISGEKVIFFEEVPAFNSMKT